jgi:hypothetical protein
MDQVYAQVVPIMQLHIEHNQDKRVIVTLDSQM